MPLKARVFAVPTFILGPLSRSCVSRSVVRAKGCSYDLDLLLILQRIVVSQTGPTART